MFRFSVREFMLLTLVVTLAVAWVVEHWRFQTAATEAKAAERWKTKYYDQMDHINLQLKRYDLEVGETDHIGLIVFKKNELFPKNYEDPFGP